MSRGRTVAEPLLGGAVLMSARPAASAQVALQDGLVNDAVGDMTILEDANVGVAAPVAVSISGAEVGPVAVVGRASVRSGTTSTVCMTGQGPAMPRQDWARTRVPTALKADALKADPATADPATAAIPVVIVSAAPDALPPEYRGPAADVLAKPFDLERVLAVLAGLWASPPRAPAG